MTMVIGVGLGIVVVLLSRYLTNVLFRLVIRFISPCIESMWSDDRVAYGVLVVFALLTIWAVLSTKHSGP